MSKNKKNEDKRPDLNKDGFSKRYLEAIENGEVKLKVLQNYRSITLPR